MPIRVYEKKKVSRQTVQLEAWVGDCWWLSFSCHLQGLWFYLKQHGRVGSWALGVLSLSRFPDLWGLVIKGYKMIFKVSSSSKGL